MLRETKRDDLIMFHHGAGAWIRNNFGLWQGNKELMESCDALFADSCSEMIIERAWEILQEADKK
ncbi:MAG: hypothetical protein K0B81_09705 [Candidatus Cloacimonetes bacterium]|nr:hypothetical protein [Candidatus Cloacimonadota bacterium]